MKHLLIFFLSFLPLLGNAKIIETHQIKDVLPYIDEHTWVIVDIDNTLYEAKQALGHANWVYDELQQRMAKGQSFQEALGECHPTWIEHQQICEVKPLEEDFIPALTEMQNRGIVVMGLTHRPLTVAPATIKQVASLQFDFIPTAPSKETFSIPALHPTLYTQGILFVSDYNLKGEVFLNFLSMIEQTPKKIVFIDDKRKNVVDLEQALAPQVIEYVGIHYTAINQVKPVYLREIAEFQSKCLNKILSNEEASLLMQHELE